MWTASYWLQCDSVCIQNWTTENSPSSLMAQGPSRQHSQSLMQRQLRWIGRVIWMQSNRLPVALYTLNCSMASEPLAAIRSASQITFTMVEEVLNTFWSARDTGIWQRSVEGCVRGGSDGFQHQLRPRTSRSSTHDHKYSSIRSSLSHLWQNLRVRIRAPESS